MQIVTQPLIIVYRTEDDKGIKVELWPPADEHYGFEGYGLLVADVIRNVALHFGVPEQSVFDWVKKEMKKPTTAFTVEKGGPTKQ